MSLKQTVGIVLGAASLSLAGPAAAQINLDDHVYAHGQGGPAYANEYDDDRGYATDAYRPAGRYDGGYASSPYAAPAFDNGYGRRSRSDHAAAYPSAIAPPPFDTGPLIRSGLIGVVGAYAGREMIIRVEDEIVYEGTPYGGMSGAWELPYQVEIYPALLAVTVDGCREPVMMEIRDRDKNPTLVIRGCDIALYND